MASVEIECPQCKANTYRLLDAKTGEVICDFCRSKWIVPSLIQKSETEKFLEEQAKRPQVVIDNTSETDEQLMQMISGLAGGALSGGARALGDMIKRVLLIVGGIVLLVIILIVLFFVLLMR